MAACTNGAIGRSQPGAGPACALVIFGATGDLTARLLCRRSTTCRGPACCRHSSRLIGIGRRDQDDEELPPHSGRAGRGGRLRSGGSLDRGGAGCSGPDRVPARRLRRSRAPTSGSAACSASSRPSGSTGGNVLFYLATPPGALRPDRPSTWPQPGCCAGGRPLAARDHREAVRHRSRIGASAQPRPAGRARGAADLPHRPLSSARRRSRTSWCSASPTASSSRSGTATTSTTCRSPSPRPSASSAAATSTTRPARCATWCRTICSSCSR